MNIKQQKFISLRADGLTFDKIATELKTAKSTLIQWSRLYQTEIKDLEYMAMMKIKEEFVSNQVQRYKITLQQLQKVDDAILNADFTEEKIKDLLTVKNNLLYQINSLEKSTVYTNTNLTTTCDITGTKSNVTLKLSEL